MDACERCGFAPSHTCQLEVHHLDSDRTNNLPSNLETLCANCHVLLHRGADRLTPRGQPVAPRQPTIITPDLEHAAKWANLFKVLGDPTRVAILVALGEVGPACVSDLTAAFDLSQPTISHHLRLLREAGFVSLSRQGIVSSYRLVPEALGPLQSALVAAS
jgi:ArsR family transcriptional regulator, arsenate/arsenite/antimonite-responsive transcriptional repressor